MKRKLTLLIAVALVCLASFSASPPTQADDFCETWWGCQTRFYPDAVECVCSPTLWRYNCTICCLDGIGCCWNWYVCP
jgi:hypothetical protein